MQKSDGHSSRAVLVAGTPFAPCPPLSGLLSSGRQTVREQQGGRSCSETSSVTIAGAATGPTTTHETILGSGTATRRTHKPRVPSRVRRAGSPPPHAERSAVQSPGYEPEVGRPGGRENVDLDRGDPYREYRERYAEERYGSDWDRPVPRPGPTGQHERTGEPWQGGYYGQGRRWSGRPFADEGTRGRDAIPGRSRDPGALRAANSMASSRTALHPARTTPATSAPGTVATPAWAIPAPASSAPRPAEGGSQKAGAGDPASRTGRISALVPAADTGPGQFSGHGPRGYRRSDERIREDVCELLTRHGEIDASDMDVDVRDATVILRGTADSGRTRRLAEELVEEIPGVRDVQTSCGSAAATSAALTR